MDVKSIIYILCIAYAVIKYKNLTLQIGFAPKKMLCVLHKWIMGLYRCTYYGYSYLYKTPFTVGYKILEITPF